MYRSGSRRCTETPLPAGRARGEAKGYRRLASPAHAAHSGCFLRTWGNDIQTTDATWRLLLEKFSFSPFRCGRILARQGSRAIQLSKGPLDRHFRIVPGESSFELRRVVISRLVQEIGTVGKHHETVREARRNPQLTLVVGTEFDPGPLAKPRRGASHVDSHVKHLAARHADQFSLRLADLVVQAAQHGMRRARVIVLHESGRHPGRLLEGGLVEAFHEETALVAEDLGLDDEHLG